MATPTPESARGWVRVGNPVAKTVLAFPGPDPAEPPKGTVLRRGTVGRTVLTFGPQPELRFTVRSAPAPDDARELAVRLKAFCDALSQYEQTLGGIGLQLADVVSGDGQLTLALRPINPDGAEDRLTAIRAMLGDGKSAATGSVGEVLQSAADPAGWVRLALAALPSVRVAQAA
jgi:hypothetical protein